MKTIILLFFCFVFSGPLFAGSIEPIIAEHKGKITSYQLENGMRFLILEDKSAPVVSFHVQVQAGSVYENLGETGTNHLIEHLAFSGTQKIGTTNWPKEKELLKKLDQIRLQIVEAKEDFSEAKIKNLKKEFKEVRLQAAQLAKSNQFSALLGKEGAVGPNAFVSHDFTVYWVELPANKIELWACLEADRLFNSVFRLFYEEIEIVKEERRTVVDNHPMGRLMEEFRAAAYQVHPYRHPIIGYAEDIKVMNRARVQDLYRRYYVPANMVVAIVGAVSAEGIKPLINRYFGAILPKSKPAFDLPQEPLRQSERRVNIKMESQPLLLVGFNIPAAGHLDMPALRVAAEIIGRGRTSRLYRRLVKEEQVAVDVHSWAASSKYPGLFYIWAMAADGYSNKDIEPLIYQEIDKLLTKPPAQEEVEAAQARLLVDFISNLKSRRNLAGRLAWFEAATGNWQDFFEQEKLIRQITPAGIKRVVEHYFQVGNRTVGSVEPPLLKEEK